MSLTVFFIVLAAAAMHAGWNAMLKLKLEPFVAMVLIHTCGTILALPLVFWFGFPKAEAWPWLAASTIIHLGYYMALSAAYARADMGQVYPIARGSAPLMTGLVGVWVFNEPVTVTGGIGIGLLAFGIFVMSLRSARDATHMDRKALLFAGLTAVTITLYTISDGIGARVSGDPHGYTAALFLLDGLCLGAFALWWKGRAGLRPMLAYLPQGFAGGAMSCGSYGIAIWAMTVAPIPLVAAVRETSVLWGAAIAVLFLGEPLRWNRIVAACLILAGLVMIRVQ
ncbi:MAG: EamA family transporter [Methylobacterium sp.]|nr:EamA family transporter [Methylobacterium sp.]